MDLPFVADPTTSVIILSNKWMTHLPHTVNALVKLSSKCEFPFLPCVTSNDLACTSYIAIAIEDSIPALADINQVAQYMEIVSQRRLLQGSCVLKEFTTTIPGQLIGEIYAVCVRGRARSKGIGGRLISTLVSKLSTRISHMWLGIKVDNPFFNAAAALYTRHGFTNPQMVTRSPGGYEIGFPVVGLTRRSGEAVDADKALVETMRFRINYLDELRTCNVPFVLSEELAKKLFDYLSREREYAGQLSVVGYKGNNAVIGFNLTTEVRGEDPPHFVVYTPENSKLYFHTHPDVCYQHYGCYLGWPSGGDMRATLHNYINFESRMNFVVTREGLYAITLTPPFMMACRGINSRSRCLQYMMEVILRTFDTLSLERSTERVAQEVSNLKLDDAQLKAYLERYFATVKAYTFVKMLNDIEQLEGADATAEVMACTDHYINSRRARFQIVDFPLYEVTYTPWSSQLTDIGRGFQGRFFVVKDSAESQCLRESLVVL